MLSVARFEAQGVENGGSDGCGAARGSGSRAAPAAESRQDRAIRWGPFSLAEVWSRGALVGAGATCARHEDADGRTATPCKKSIRFGQNNLTLNECMLRLKRWLIAGLDDSSWPPEARHHHVKLGGPGLRDFAAGLDEPTLDELARASA